MSYDWRNLVNQERTTTVEKLRNETLVALPKRYETKYINVSYNNIAVVGQSNSSYQNVGGHGSLNLYTAQFNLQNNSSWIHQSQ
jgi:hypothetical protein